MKLNRMYCLKIKLFLIQNEDTVQDSDTNENRILEEEEAVCACEFIYLFAISQNHISNFSFRMKTLYRALVPRKIEI